MTLSISQANVFASIDIALVILVILADILLSLFKSKHEGTTRQFLIRTGIVAGVSVLGFLPIGLILLYLFNVLIPNYLNNIIFGLGFIFGLFVWPVRVFPVERGQI